MAHKHIYILLLALVALGAGQGEDELHIPVENDNQFPPEQHTEFDGSILEGSGTGALEEPVDVTTYPSTPLVIEDVQLVVTETEQTEPPLGEDIICPKPCVCNTEGDTDNFVVDCSGYELTEFPKPLDLRTTTLNLQNNKLTEIPKTIAELINLKVLNVNNNSIMDLDSGSVSNLPELTVLKLAQNRLMEYPKDLKNSISQTKLEELDLGGNDMRTTLSSENFSNFKALRKLTLPLSTPQLLEDLCRDLKDTLESVCTGSCMEQSFECPEAPEKYDEDLLTAVLPGTIPLSPEFEANLDPTIESQGFESNTEITPEQGFPPTTPGTETTEASVANETSTQGDDFSLRSVVSKEPEPIAQLNSLVEASSAVLNGAEADLNAEATTVSTKTGGVDKSLIGIIVAGMVVVVAGITIKKNWSSIKNKFSSSPRAPTDRDRVTNANGTAPEEVPLQEKSPV